MSDTLVVGQGLAGATLAWCLHRAGQDVAVLDRPAPGAASRVAPGLYTPISGRRLALPWGGVETIEAMAPFYRRVESETSARFLHPLPALRIFHREEERESWARRREWPSHRPYVEAEWTGTPDLPGLRPGLGAIRIGGAGWLDIPAYLDAVRGVLAAAGRVVDEAVDARRTVYCDGHAVAQRPDFDFLPLRPCKGDILTIATDDPLPDHSLHRNGIYLLPLGEGRARAGGVFVREFDHTEPSEAERAAILAGLAEMIDLRFEVTDHRAGVRPSTSHFKPVAGFLPEQPAVGIFNSLTSQRRASTPRPSPGASPNSSSTGVPSRPRSTWPPSPPSTDELERLRPPPGPPPRSARRQRHRRHRRQRGATPPSSSSTAARCSASTSRRRPSKPPAIVRRAANPASGSSAPATKPCWEHARDWRGEVAVVMFNLGYLPGGDKSLVTRPDTTLPALRAALDLLAPGGLVSVVAYPGHFGGAEESEAVEAFLRDLPPRGVRRDGPPGPQRGPGRPALLPRARPSDWCCSELSCDISAPAGAQGDRGVPAPAEPVRLGYASSSRIGACFLDAGETDLESARVDMEALVVDAEPVEDRGLDVVDMGPGRSTTWNPNSSVAPMVRPGRMPPPAIHMVKAWGWWSRPRLRPSAALASTIGVRPNSPPHTTSVSSSMPRCFEVAQQRGGRPVGLRRLAPNPALDVGVVVPAGVVDLDESDAAFGQATGQQAVVGEGRLAVAGLGPVQRQGVRALLREVHEFGGAALHAEGHLVGRDAGVDLPDRQARRGVAGLSEPIKSSVSRWTRASIPGGLETCRIGSPLSRNGTPWCALGSMPALHMALPPLRLPPLLRTTKAGRSSASAPSP